MPGDRELGAVLRGLRRSRGLTLGTVARQAGCAESLISYVESGSRRLHPWLAVQLDDIYRTGGVVASLLRGTERRRETSTVGVSGSDTLVVELPKGGVSMPLSRRELFAALSVGIAGGALLSQFERALDNIPISIDTLQFFEDTYEGFQAAVRAMPPAALIDGLIGNVAILDGLRRRSDRQTRLAISRMQARYAESLSWLSEEAGDLPAAMYWIDRACQWGQAADWPAMSAYGFVRRSMMVISFSSDGRRAVDNASAVLAMRNVSPRMQGLATKQIAFGQALAGDADASSRALDGAMQLLSQPAREEDAILGQRSVVMTTCSPFSAPPATCTLVVEIKSSRYWNRGLPLYLPHRPEPPRLLAPNWLEPTPMWANHRKLHNCPLPRLTTVNASDHYQLEASYDVRCPCCNAGTDARMYSSSCVAY